MGHDYYIIIIDTFLHLPLQASLENGDPMNDTIYLIYIISFVVGSILGLVLSYRKYTAPYVTKNIDVVALIISIIGWMLALNGQLITLIPSFITITIGIFLLAMVLGMRPGYGRYETVIGFTIAALVWIIRMVLV